MLPSTRSAGARSLAVGLGRYDFGPANFSKQRILWKPRLAEPHAKDMPSVAAFDNPETGLHPE